MERIPVDVDGHTVTAFSEGNGDDVILVGWAISAASRRLP